MSKHSREDLVRIAWIYRQSRNLLAIPQPKMGPCLSGVRRFVDAVADGEIGSVQPLSATDVNDIWIGCRHRDRANGLCRLLIENRIPSAPIVVRLPHATVHLRHIEDIGLAGNAGSCPGAPSAQRAYGAP